VYDSVYDAIPAANCPGAKRTYVERDHHLSASPTGTRSPLCVALIPPQTADPRQSDAQRRNPSAAACVRVPVGDGDARRLRKRLTTGAGVCSLLLATGAVG
jgi:hypothetical protein